MVRKLQTLHSTKNKLFTAISTLCALPAFASTLDQSALQDEIKWLQEESYVSTATKTLEHVKKSGASVSIITASDLKRMGARNLMDALKRIPGFGIYQTNMGRSTLEVRGVKTDFSEKVLFLFNGHPNNNNLVNGGALSSYNNLSIEDISRVEIVRGPGSALYGANAFVAIINIITKKANDTNETTLTTALGTYETKKVNLSYINGTGSAKVAANLNVLETEGLNNVVESDAIGTSGEIDDWRKRYELSFTVSNGPYQLQGKYLQRRSGAYLGANNVINDDSEQQYIDYFLEASFQKALTQALSINTKVYFDHFQFDNLWEIFPEGFTDDNNFTYAEGLLLRSPIKHDKYGAEIQLDYKLSDDHKIIGGLLFEHQSQYNVELWSNGGSGPLQNISSVANWNGNHNRDITAAYLQDIWDINNSIRLIYGARYDHYDDFGGSFNPRASLIYELTNETNLTTTYGSAFRAPTFGELYNINNPSIVGNPDVQPEEIETFEVALNGKFNKRMEYKATGFHNKISDLIASVPSNTAVNHSGNVGKLSVSGIELELESRLKNGSLLNINYTFQYSKNDLSEERSPDIPRQKLNTSFSYRYSRFANLYAGLNFRGKLPRDKTDNRADIPSHATLDLALNLSGKEKRWEATASIYNFFDKQYTDPTPVNVMHSDYPTQGRSFMLELSYRL